MNMKHENMKFPFEAEKDSKIAYLDVNIYFENGKFVNNVFRKETLTGA